MRQTVWLAGLAVVTLCLASCGEKADLDALAKANQVELVELPKSSSSQHHAYLQMARLPASVVDAKAIETSFRPGGTPYSTDQRRHAVAKNANLWGAIARASTTNAVPESLESTGASSVRDFPVLGLLTAWRHQFEGTPASLASVVDAYGIAIGLARNGALVHAEAGKEVALGLDSVERFPAVPNSYALLKRLAELVAMAPSPAEVLDRERLNRLHRYGKLYRSMAESPAAMVDAESKAYYLTPKAPILRARDAYWSAWVEYSRNPEGATPKLPEELSGPFADATERDEAMLEMIASIRTIRLVGERLQKRLVGNP